MSTSLASADPLTLGELNRFNTWVQCAERCADQLEYAEPSSPTYEEQRARFMCLSECGVPAHTWEKDGARASTRDVLRVYPIDRHDLKLAILELQSASLNPEAQTLNQQFNRLGFGDAFDPAQLICYGDALLEEGSSAEESSSAEEGSSAEEAPEELEGEQVTRAAQRGEQVIVGTLCPYVATSEDPRFGCPYLEGVEVEGETPYYPFCNTDVCALPKFDLNAPLAPISEDGVYWAGTYRPLVCPDVVCELYAGGREPEGDLALCEPGTSPDVPRWLEQRLGERSLCDLSAHGESACALDERCVYDERFGRGVCEPRCAVGEACTVAHLELKSESDQELIAWVYFDHSDAPVRALDLHLSYPREKLVLADARRLPALLYSGSSEGKQLATQHLSDGLLRLSIFDTASSAPIPYGPIVELVFKRTGDGEVTLSFTDDSDLREMSMAPLHEQAQAGLRGDEVWGEPLTVGSRTDASLKLSLWYNFEDHDAPLSYRNVHSGEELCDVVASCALELEVPIRDRLISKLDRLQAGEARLDRSIEGVLAEAGYLNGSMSHLRLPLTMSDELNANAQSFSMSMWFYTEGNLPHESLDTPQVLFAHHDRSERTRFGLWLRASPYAEGEYDLELFDGDLLARDLPTGLTRVPLATLPTHAWQHLTFTYDAPHRLMRFYLNGEPLGTDYQFPTASANPLSCPQFSRGRDLILHDEGDILGGKPSELLYVSVKESGRYKIKRRDLNGSVETEVLGDGEFSYIEPDYHPLLDRLVYVSDATGSPEVWISNGLGGDRHQLTVGFGDSYLGFAAHSPKWAPDGTGIVFESNAFDLIARDNLDERVYHLYYLGYDARENLPSIMLADGSTTDQLDYQARLNDQSLVYYRLTGTDNIRHHRKPRWLEGSDDDLLQRGRLLFEHSSPLYTQKGISELRIDEVVPLSTFNALEGLTRGEESEELSLLDAKLDVRASVDGPQAVERMIYKRTFSELYDLGQGDSAPNSIRLLGPRVGESERPETAHSFRVSATLNPADHTATIELYYLPLLAEMSSSCWDRNANGLRESEEDITGDAVWDEEDCALAELSQLYVELDVARLDFVEALPITPLLPNTELARSINISRAPWNKEVNLSELSSPGRLMVGVQVTSPYNTYPMYRVGGALPVARFKVRSRGGNLGDIDTWTVDQVRSYLHVKQRLAEEELVVRDLSPNPETCWDLNQDRLQDPREDRNQDGVYDELDCFDQVYDSQGKFELIRDAKLSPNSDSLLLDAISLSRPVLLYGPDLISAERAVSVSERSGQLKGVSWRYDERLFPCNWVGAVQHPINKNLMTALRGGLDELKLHLGVRDINSIRSEAERGRDWLDRQASLTSQRPRCGASHLECPAFHLCVDSECVVTSCDPSAMPDELGSCTPYGAQCRLRPVTIEAQEGGLGLSGGADWVCVADCQSDRECYTQTCLNGPCLFCDVNSSACSECRETEVNLGGLTVKRTEGCPDERSFYCDTGACRTECYSFEDDQSLYLCDPVTEFCDQGRCVLRDWSWEDLSPLTMMGASDAQFALAPSEWSHYTVAIGERYPVQVHAYGVEDYGSSPEVLVEVRGGPFYGGDWHTLGRLSVHNRTQAEATSNPLVLDSVHPYTSIRLKLITSPYQNPSASATGLGTRDLEFCVSDVINSGIAEGAAALALCRQRAQGSRFQLGYRLDVPEYESIQACRDRGHAGCPTRGQNENDYIYGGAPGVVVLDVLSNGGSVMNALARNTVCSYAGGLRPVSLEGGPEKLFYGRISAERSPQRAHYCERSPEACFADVNEPETLNFEGSFALLNCNYVSADQPSESAYAEFVNIPYLPPKTNEGPIALDNGDSCVINIDNLRSEVCYEWQGGAVSLDAYTKPMDVNQTLEMSVSRSFGHDRGFTPIPPPTHPLRVRVTGYTGVGLALTNGLGELLPVQATSTGETVVEFEPIYKGWHYALSVARQPLDASMSCHFVGSETPALSGSASGALDGYEFSVRCIQGFSLEGCVNYVTNACAQNLNAGKSLSLLINTQGNVARSQLLTAYADGHFRYPRGLSPGESYSVSVATSPRGLRCSVTSNGEGTVDGVRPQPVEVTCEDIPGERLAYVVEGLSPSSELELLERYSVERATVTSAQLNNQGVGELTSAFVPNDPYQLIIVRQPSAQTCSIAQSSGLMPVGGLTEEARPIITCQDLPSFPLSVTVMGLTPGGSVSVTLHALNGAGEVASSGVASLSVPAESGSEVNLDLLFSSPTLYHMQAYRLEVNSSSPESVTCEAVNLADPEATSFTFRTDVPLSETIIRCRDANDVREYFSLSGQVYGYTGTGLKLSLNNSPELLQVEEGADSFDFGPKLPDDANYDVIVKRQPAFSFCEVLNGSGVISGVDVTDLEVHCSPSGQLEVSLTGLPEGAEVEYTLFSVPRGNVAAALVGEARSDLVVRNGEVSSPLVSPGGGSNEATSLAVGDYHLYVYVNSNGSVDSTSNEPTFGLGDQGLYRRVTVSAGQVTYLDLNQGHLSPLMAVYVAALAPENADLDREALIEAPMTCVLSPPGTFIPGGGARRVPNPTRENAPVVSVARRACTSECELEDDSYVTNYPAYIPLQVNVTYDLSCFVDANDSDARDSGDFVYSSQVSTLLNLSLIPVALTELP